MYAWPVLLPAQTNREDFLRTVQLFDDDTGEAIDLSGRTLANPGDFTGANWTVTDGAIVTNSVTPLTIKDYPFGNEMQAMASTVGPNLTIAANDPITFADPTGLNTMTGYVTSYAPSTGALVVQVGAAFDLEIRACRDHHLGGYTDDSFGIDIGPSGPIIRAQLGSGITVVDIGRIQVLIPASQIFKLRHRTYDVGLLMWDGAPSVRQIFVGKQPMLSGGVSQMPMPIATSNPYGLP